MKCILCAKTSIEVQIDPFPLSAEAREMLQGEFGINADEALANHGICGECSALPFVERNRLAEKAVKSEQDEFRRDIIRDDLKKRLN